ncbi:hypothetical protein V6Z12_D12G167600 [Gossypium hirsutum]
MVASISSHKMCHALLQSCNTRHHITIAKSVNCRCKCINLAGHDGVEYENNKEDCSIESRER